MSASRLEGEEWEGFGETNANAPVIPKIPSSNSPDSDDPHKPNDNPTPIDIPPEIPSAADETPSESDT